jgi:hypothetical protein
LKIRPRRSVKGGQVCFFLLATHRESGWEKRKQPKQREREREREKAERENVSQILTPPASRCPPPLTIFSQSAQFRVRIETEEIRVLCLVYAAKNLYCDISENITEECDWPPCTTNIVSPNQTRLLFQATLTPNLSEI